MQIIDVIDGVYMGEGGERTFSAKETEKPRKTHRLTSFCATYSHFSPLLGT
ncbi:MAG: hypothetical protein Q4G63_10085 [Bacteroidia bacterium]|nr:hypothetical protein [Bacteroidia bacterium]